MKSTKLLLGLLSSLFLFIGFAKAAEVTNPLKSQVRDARQVLSDSARFCGVGPCNWADIDR